MNVRTYEVNPFAIDTVRIIPVGAYSSGGISDEAKQAILDAFEHVAWTDDQGQTYVDAIRDAFFPPATLLRIQAVYTQSGTVYTTDSLDSLKTDLVVTAVYTDSTTETVTTYTLSGTLTAGESTITVSYGGKTTTFKVNVTAPATLVSISAVYTQSGTVYDTDSLDSLKSDLVVTATWSDSSTSTVAAADYTLSGTLAEGTSTITVSYGGKTTTFTVTVTEDQSISWDYTMGLPEANGYTKDFTESGNPTATLESDGLALVVNGPSANAIRYELSEANANSSFEVVFKTGSVTGGINRIHLHTSESLSIGIRVQHSQNYKGIYLWNASSVASMTKLDDCELNTQYKIKLVTNNGYGSVYINDQLVHQNYDLSSLTEGGTTTRFSLNSSSSGTAAVNCKLISMRYTVGA